MARNHPVARCIQACGIAGLLSLACTNTLASGFALIEQSVSGMGTAYAIGSAGINDASTIYFNPAGMSRLSGSRITGNLQIVNANTDVKATGYYNPNNLAILGSGLAGAPISHLHARRGTTIESQQGRLHKDRQTGCAVVRVIV